jgi:hypothetical protein
VSKDVLSDSVLRRIDDIVDREVAGELFMVPIRGHLADLQELFVVNDTGRWLWDRLDGSSSVQELVLGMTAEFDVDQSEAERDVRAFLSELLEVGLVVESGPGAT